MASYLVTGVRTALGADRAHRHLRGVCTSDGGYFTVRQVVDSLNAGNQWVAVAGDSEVAIRVVPFCPKRACLASPYLATRRGSGWEMETIGDC